MNKEMNWLFVKENYSKMFKDVFGKESSVLDIINLEYVIARTQTDKEIRDEVRKLEAEMSFMVSEVYNGHVTKEKLGQVRKLHSWCFNMIDNLIWVLDNKDRLNKEVN